ncbi:MAG TPA: GntR family transcriptional regulator [Edaphobacter sp.]|jgi:GntR family transcriptional regulator
MKSLVQSAPLEFAFRLDHQSGVPVYRQLIDQVQAGIATGALSAGDQLPTVRRVAVDLAINPNTVVRAYREMEVRGILDTQQGTGTFVAEGSRVEHSKDERERMLLQLVTEFAARAGSAGFKIHEVLEALQQMSSESEVEGKRR